MAQDDVRFVCQCCGLSSPNDELGKTGNDLLMGNSIELKELDNASNNGCKFCGFLAAVFRHSAPEKHHIAQFQFERMDHSSKLSAISYQNEFQGSRQAKTDIFRVRGE